MTYTIPGWSTPQPAFGSTTPDSAGGIWNGSTWNGEPPSSQVGPEITSSQKSLLNPSLTSFPGEGSSSGPVAVDTDAMAIFSSNIHQYLPAIKDAMKVLANLPPVAAGCLPEAYTINGQVNSQASTGGSGSTSASDLVDNFGGVLLQCYRGVTDLHTMMQTMAKKYTTTDDANNMSVTTLDNDMAAVSSDFNNMMTANGGTGSDDSGD
jgi:hypothetical protein